MNVASAEVWKVAKFRWENLPRLCQVVAAMDLVKFFIDYSKGDGEDNVMDFSQDLKW